MRSFAEIPNQIELVKELRRRTLSGYMDCKKAIEECNGDVEKAIEHLRKKGMLKAGTKADRVTSEGVIAVATKDDSPHIGIMLELNSETDFVSRGEVFNSLAKQIAQICHSYAEKNINDSTSVSKALNVEEITKQKGTTLPTVGDEIKDMIAKLGENIQLRRAHVLAVPKGKGVVSSYIHRSLGKSENGVSTGAMGSLISIESSTNNISPLTELGKKLSAHVIGFNPEVVSRTDITPEIYARKRAEFEKRQADLGKSAKIPQNRFEDMVANEISLMDQTGMGDMKIKDVIQQTSKSVQSPVAVSKFVKYVCGEGIQKSADNFSDEVQKLAGQK